jgi:hypothetical protein
MTDRSIAVNRRIRTLLLCLCLAAVPAGLLAQSAPASQFIFPHFVAFTGESTGIAIFNPNSWEAVAVLTLRAPDGSLAGGENNPATVTIPAHGQLVKIVWEIFGSQVHPDSSLVVTSSAPGLTTRRSIRPSLSWTEAMPQRPLRASFSQSSRRLTRGLPRSISPIRTPGRRRWS